MCTLKSPQILIRTHQNKSHIKKKYRRKNNKNCSKAHQQRKLPSHSKAKKNIEKCWGFNNTKQLIKQLNKQVRKLQRCTPACKHKGQIIFPTVLFVVVWDGRDGENLPSGYKPDFFDG